MAARAQPLKMGNHQVQGVADGVDPSDAVNKGQLDAAIATVPGTVTSVAVSGGTTGLTTSGGPITGSGTITLAGTLDVDNGGTGATSLTANNVILGNGTSAVQFVDPGESGNVLTSDGTTWTSAAAQTTWTLVKKTSDQTASSTSFADDSALTFSVAANKTYFFRGSLYYTSGTGGYKFAVNGPASPTAFAAGNVGASAGTTYNVAFVSSTASETNMTAFHGILQNGLNAGAVVIRIAQNAAGTSLSVKKGSFLEYVEIA